MDGLPVPSSGEVSRSAKNVIPPTCTISIDRRFLPSETGAAVRAEIEQALASLSLESSGLHIDVAGESLAESAATPHQEDIVRVALQSLSEVCGRPSAAGGFSACCDMWHLANTGKIPTVIFGPGELSQAHKANEHIDVRDLETATRIYRQIATNWLGV